MNPAELPPLGLYVHLPWCVSKCPYCDFNSHKAGEPAARDRYVAALRADLDAEAAGVAERTLDTVFIGGGTPSLFSPGQIGTILSHVRASFRLAADAEITMEANPGTVECGELKGYREAGITRLSLGVQSTDAGSLTRLGRIHGPEEAEAALGEARAAGFASVNADLMFGLPGQTPAQAERDLTRLLGFAPDHVSYYQLTLEPNTVFHARPPADLPGDDASAEMQARALSLLAERGYARYEVSAYARPGARCRHNLNYWSFGDYLGVGAGAHGKLSDERGIWRTEKPAHPQAYMETAGTRRTRRQPGPADDAPATLPCGPEALASSAATSVCTSSGNIRCATSRSTIAFLHASVMSSACFDVCKTVWLNLATGANAECMYDPRLRGTTTAARIEVK